MYSELDNATRQELLSALDDNDIARSNIQWEIAQREEYLRELQEERNTVLRALDEFHGGIDEARG